MKTRLAVAACLICGLALAQRNDYDYLTKSTTAIGYEVGGGSTKVDLNGTGAIMDARGEAEVQAKKGVTNIEVYVKGMPPASRVGTKYLTYVLWVVSPDGRTINVGEILINGSGEGRLNATTELQAFSLLVSAEPYFAVRQPSETIVLENALRKGTKGRIYPIKEYKLMRRTYYEEMGKSLPASLDLKNVPLDVYQARHATEIAKFAGAEKYAPEIYSKAVGGVELTESALARKTGKKDILGRARSTVQFAEDARMLAVQRQAEERVTLEREAAAARAKADAEAKAAAEAAEAKRIADQRAAELKRKADEEARQQAEIAAAREAKLQAEAAEEKRRAEEDAKRQAEVAAAREAKLQAEAAEEKRRVEEEAKRQAELAAAREAQLKAEAEAAALRSKAEADALRAKEEAAKAEAERARLAAEELRARLLDQLNRILETKDSPRGLVVTMADVLFDTGKYNLRPATREKLARLSGIVLANPGLKLEVEGHTDSTGSDELNQKLSEQRAETVRSYLVEQGLAADTISAKGYGKTMPVVDNSTAAGRQQNRRVEMVVSGEVIGTKIGN